MRGRLTLLGLALLVGSVACTKPKTDAGSCTHPKELFCVDYAAEQAAAGKRLCAGQQWNAGPCPTANRIGACSSPESVAIYYSGPPANNDAVSAKRYCEHVAGATWGP